MKERKPITMKAIDWSKVSKKPLPGRLLQTDVGNRHRNAGKFSDIVREEGDEVEAGIYEMDALFYVIESEEVVQEYETLDDAINMLSGRPID